MSQVLKDAYQLVDGVLEQGLPFVGSYLEKRIRRPILITDDKGQIHYPDAADDLYELDDMFIQLPTNIPNNKYFYQEVDKSLYYRVGLGGSSAYVVARSLPAEMIGQAVCVLMESKLAIKCYFAKINKRKNEFEAQIAEYLSFKSNVSMTDIIQLSEKPLDINRPYVLLLLQLEEASQVVDRRIIRSYLHEYLKRQKGIEVISILLPEYLTFIMPAHLKNNSLEVDLLWPIADDLLKYKEIIETRFNTRIALGIGSPYPLSELCRSYNEARIALTLPRLMGKDNFIQKFTDLGVFAFIFSKDTEVLKEYCLKTFGKLLEEDKKKNSELMPTLRSLIENNFNRKTTADRLFIHINTLHYRLAKIEQILDIDLSRIDIRLGLFTAIKVYDTLQFNGLWT